MKQFLNICFLISISLFLSPAQIFAQAESSIKVFNTSNALPQNSITAMTFDDDGYLWLGTHTGLIRYNGSSFTPFFFSTSNAVTDLSNSVLSAFHIPGINKTLIRTRDGILYSIQKGKPVLYSNAISKTTYLYELNGYFPNLRLVDKFNLSSDELNHKHGWNPNTKHILPVNNTDFLILSNTKKSVFYYNDVNKVKEIQLKSDFQGFLKCGDKKLYYDNKQSLYLFDEITKEFNKIETEGMSFSINTPADAVNFNFYYWDKFNDDAYCQYQSTFYRLRYNELSKKIGLVPAFSIKEKGHLWTGLTQDKINSTFFLSTLNEGLFQVKVKRIKTFNMAEYMEGNKNATSAINYSILKTSDSSAITTTGIEFIASSNKTSIIKLKDLYCNRETIGLLSDTAIICPQRNQLFYFRKRDKYSTRYVFNDAFNKQNVATITLVQPEGDSIWVGTNRSINCITRTTNNVIIYRPQDARTVFFGLNQFFRYSKNEAFVSNKFGLYKMTTTAPYRLDTIAQFNGKAVRHISRYKQYLILSVYKDGLYIMKDNNWYRVPLSKNQPQLAFCHSTYIDKNNNIWVPTDKGLFKSTVEGILQATFTKDTEPYFFSYGEAEGIPNAEFNGGGTPTYIVLKNGQIFYPNMGGIVTFIPEYLDDKISNNTIPIESLSIDNEEIQSFFSDTVSLEASFKYITISLSVAYFGEQENLLLEYQLDKQNWQKINTGSSQRFTIHSLTSGYHTITIRKRTGFSGKDYVYKTITLYRKKNLSEQIWFYPAIAALLAGLLLLFTKLNTRSINRKRKMLQKLVNEQTSELTKTGEIKELLINIISHDMIAPLRYISFISGILEKNLEKDPAKIASALADIKNTSGKIMTDSLSIINWMKYNSHRVTVNKSNTNLHSLVNEIIETYIPIAKTKNIVIKNEIQKSKFADIDYNIFSIIITNLVSNAVKYSKHGEIKIHFEDSGDTRTTKILRVTDTGPGIPTDALYVIQELIKGNIMATKTTNKASTGLGYLLISELVRIHELAITVESEPDKGTSVSIFINHADSASS